ncbi:unnamed protein product [Closterium sp. NIES-54]
MWVAVSSGVLAWMRNRKMIGKSDKSKHENKAENKAKQTGRAKQADAAAAAPIQGACVRFSLADMVAATSDWAPQQHLTRGSYSELFKGVDPRDGATPWLLKRRLRCTDEFQAEVAEMGHKNHPHLVRLLGYCDEEDEQGRREQVAVYEFMTGGSIVDKFGPGCTGTPLTLQQRLDILIGVARGLEYLNTFGIVHRGLNPSNILLDARMRGKIAGFDSVASTAAVSEGERLVATTGVRGYVDPHLLLSHEPSTTNDLYSLGVVMLELLSGRRSLTPRQTTAQTFRESVSVRCGSVRGGGASVRASGALGWVAACEWRVHGFRSDLQANNLAALFDPALASSFLPHTTANTSANIPSSSTTSIIMLASAASTSTAGTTAGGAVDTPLSVPIPNALIPSLVQLARAGLACTSMPASSRPSLGRILAELEIVRDDVAKELRKMEEEAEKQAGKLEEGNGGAAEDNTEQAHLDSWAGPPPPSDLSSDPPSQPPPPPPVVVPSSALPLAPLLCQQVSVAEVVRATGGWAAERRIGSGGFGDVYRGVSPLDGCTPWAVKRAKVLTNDFRRERGERNGIGAKFPPFPLDPLPQSHCITPALPCSQINEMASKHHPNLVRLLGFCMDYDAASERMEQIAIYEFMPNGDLYQRMHSEATGKVSPLTLQQRLDILIGAARGLEYLHSFGIVHRDIKPANILLDKHMQAKVSDFGLLRMGEGSCSVQSTRVMGTPGYVDPVYSITRKATPSADVYSFGVLMMELLACKHVVMLSEDGSHTNIKEWVEQQVERGSTASVVNGDLKAPHAMACTLVEMSLSCVARLVSDRPSMSHVLVQLETLQREYMGGKQERVAKQLDAKVKQACLDCRPLEEELEIINSAYDGGD